MKNLEELILIQDSEIDSLQLKNSQLYKITDKILTSLRKYSMRTLIIKSVFLILYFIFLILKSN